MNRFWRALLILVALVCFGVALSYPIRYRLAEKSNNDELESLSAMRARVREEQNVEMPMPVVSTAAPAEGRTDAAPGTSGNEASGTAGTSVGAQGSGTGGMPEGGTEVSPEGRTDAAPGTSGNEVSGATGTTGAAQGSGTGGMPEGGTEVSPEGRTDAAPAGPAPVPTDTPRPTPTPGMIDIADELWMISVVPPMLAPTPTPRPTGPTPVPTDTPVPSPTPDRSIRHGALPYPSKEKVELDESKILPELREIYELNHDLVGWITIPKTEVDYPVVQTEDSEYYLDHDFYGNENINGQIILDTLCDPYTPSYNLVISGHHMKNKSMFGGLSNYASKSYWSAHRFVEFDTLMTRKQYVIFAAFYSADYDEDEEGFRYNADLQYRKDVESWLVEIHDNQIYDTGIDAEFGDEFITLTTCSHARRQDGRFVLVCRQIREGETFE